MKKVILATSSLLLLSLIAVTPAFAGNFTTVSIAPPDGLVKADVGINDIIRFVLTLLVVVGVLASLIFLIYGGIKWITSGGDKGAVETARGQIVAAIVGLIVIIMSFAILSFVLQLLGISQSDIFNIKVPKLVNPTP